MILNTGRSRRAGHLAEIRRAATARAGAARLEAAWLTDHDAASVPESGKVLQACVASRAAWWAGEIAWWRRCLGIDERAPEPAAEPWALLLAGRAGDAAAAWHRLGCPYEEAVALSHSDEAADLACLSCSARWCRSLQRVARPADAWSATNHASACHDEGQSAGHRTELDVCD